MVVTGDPGQDDSAKAQATTVDGGADQTACAEPIDDLGQGGTRHRHRDQGRWHGHGYLAAGAESPVESAAMNASCGTSTRPTIFMRFLPSFCFSSSLRLRLMSPP